MKLFRAILFFLCAGTSAIRAELPSGWSTNYSATLAEAAAGQEPVLVFFTASWCGPCKFVTQITLTDPGVEASLAGTRHVAVDIDAQGALATKLGVTAVPTFVLLAASGEEVERATGFQPVGDFLTWLTNSVSQAKAAAIQLANFKKQLADVDELLASTNAAAARKAAAELGDLCAARDQTIVRAAVTRLQKLALREPQAVLDGLNDPRLATRIQVANALRVRLGETFEADPWSDEASRSAAIEKWRNRLAPDSDPAKAR